MNRSGECLRLDPPSTVRILLQQPLLDDLPDVVARQMVLSGEAVLQDPEIELLGRQSRPDVLYL
jgi:hypothetical protein